MPLTTVYRTLADLGSVVSPNVLERSVEWALRQGYVSVGGLQGVVETRSGTGARRLAAVLAVRPPGAPPTESDAETLFIQLVRHGGFPHPTRQYRLRIRGRYGRLDFAWPLASRRRNRWGRQSRTGRAAWGFTEAEPHPARWMVYFALPGQVVAYDWARVTGKLRQAWELRSVVI